MDSPLNKMVDFTVKQQDKNQGSDTTLVTDPLSCYPHPYPSYPPSDCQSPL